MRAPSESTRLILEHLKGCLNLTEYEARVYEFLVRAGPSTARDISISCGVPRTKVYETLGKLMRRGMVFELSLNPKVFMASPPGEIFKQFLNIQEMVVKDFHTVTLNLQKIYEESMGLSGIEREEIWLFTGANALDRVANIISSAEKSIEILSSWKAFLHFYNAFRGLIDDLLGKRVKVKLYIPFGSEADARSLSNLDISFKHIKGLPLALIFIIDEKHILVRLVAGEDEFLQGGEWILINHEKTLNILKKALLQKACSTF